MTDQRVIFVCNGNVFRSMAAEYCLKDYLNKKKIKGWKITSAGITARPQRIKPKTIETLSSLGIKNIKHKQRKLNKKLLKKHDKVIVMARDQLNFIKKNFNFKPILFNELTINKKTSITDIEDEIKNPEKSPLAVENKIEKTIKYIYNKTPELFKKISLRK